MLQFWKYWNLQSRREFSLCVWLSGGERGVEWVCQSLYCSPGPPCSKVTFYIKALIQYTKRIFLWGLPWWSISGRCAILRINYIWNSPFVYWACVGKGNTILCFLPVNWRRIQNLLPRVRTWGSVWLLCVDTELGGQSSRTHRCVYIARVSLIHEWIVSSMNDCINVRVN